MALQSYNGFGMARAPSTSYLDVSGISRNIKHVGRIVP